MRRNVGTEILRTLDSDPEALAVVDDGHPVSRRELKDFVVRAAARLSGLGVAPGDMVVVCAPRSVLHVGLAIAVVAQGSTYVPLDDVAPSARNLRLVGRLKPSLLVAPPGSDMLDPASVPCPVVVLDECFAQQGESFQLTEHDGGDHCYVIHTSGSSGVPKGVLVGHGALLNRLEGCQETYPIGPGDRVLWHANVGFDFSLWEMFAPLLLGASIIIGSGEEDPESLARDMVAAGVTVVHFVPRMLDRALSEVVKVGTLRFVFSGGATLPTAVVNRWVADRPDVPLFNQYGPTEACIDALTHRCAALPDEIDVPIGSPNPGYTLLVVDDELRPLPPTSVGELIIGGVGVGEGYVGRPDLTEQVFVELDEDLYGAKRFYRTGDRAFTDEAGLFHFVGRLDRQVQVNGVRVELGEVEAALLGLDGVVEAHVLPIVQDEYVVGLEAFVVGEAGLKIHEIRRRLVGAVPISLIPGRMTMWPCGALPRTHKGEVDISALRKGSP
ncbi:MAG: amino acid adenylation domain-containing protein [Bifidobacteriaceae bacterium]|jgi:amino acid adenylation domain-containing protein|nr:amino acid adenylation domain-containing protein [Bifidobacteriaceae bacterium]